MAIEQSKVVGILAYPPLLAALKERQGIKGGVAEYVAQPENVHLVRLIATGINQLIKEYNETTIGDENRELLIATALAKEDIPTIPTLEDMYAELKGKGRDRRTESVWFANFRAAIKILDIKMEGGEVIHSAHPKEPILDLDLRHQQSLFYGLSNAHPKALAFGVGLHALEECARLGLPFEARNKFRKDKIIDALTEMLVLNHRNPNDPYFSLFQLLCRPESPNEDTAGLGWVEGYDNLSEEIREIAEQALKGE